MINSDLRQMIDRGCGEFSRRYPLLSLWQELALNFYPQRANFTTDMTLGKDFASHLTSSYPALVMRTLQSAVPAMLRPKDVDWFKIEVEGVEDDLASKEWLQEATRIQRKFMYRRDSGFVRCMSEVDADFMCFGNGAKYVTESRDRDRVIYKSVNLRDIVFFEDSAGQVCEVHRRESYTAVEAIEEFGADNLDSKIFDSMRRKETRKFKFHHIVFKGDMYHGYAPEIERRNFPYISIWVDVENMRIVEQSGSYNLRYIVSRWQTVSGFQYGYSPASQLVLPDARLHQDMMLTMLEVAQKSADPPMVGTDDVVRSDVNAYAGGITWLDRDYDERLGQGLRPMTVDRGGLGYALQMVEMIKGSISDGLYENKLTLPPADANMTATEVMQRVKEYARTALPLFSPIEEEESLQTCEMTFDILMRYGAFGSRNTIPDMLRGSEVKFTFMSPLSEGRDEMRKQQYNETLQITANTMQLDEGAASAFDVSEAYRDLLQKSDIPAEWLRSKDEVEMLQRRSEGMRDVQQASQVAQDIGAGVQAVQGGVGG